MTTLLLLLGALALAQDPPADLDRARELFENGRILYDEGSYEQAIVAWQEAYRLSQKPELYYNISGAYEKLGRYREAIDALNQYRAMAPATERDVLDRRIRALEDRLAAAPAPSPVAPAPTPQPVAAAPAPAPDRGRKVPVVPVVLLGTGVVGLGIGGVTGVQAGAALSDLRDSCVEGEGGLLCPDTAESTVDHQRTSSTISAVSLTAGGALALTGTLWLALAGGSDGDLAVAPWASANGIGLAGGFR
jgi:tetratricopeptide (TPR) repeat protein